jgi:hypothetical protein
MYPVADYSPASNWEWFFVANHTGPDYFSIMPSGHYTRKGSLVMRRIDAGTRVALLGLAVLLAAASCGEASTVTVFNANVNEWSSSTVADPSAGIYPIGGSGAINGGFVVTTASDGAQIGLRGELRHIGLLPQTNDGVLTATYFAPAGTSGSNLSLWNFAADIDLRGTGHTISDYTATLTLTDISGLVTPVNLVTSGFIPGNAVLYQNSENPGFPFLSTIFPSFNPSALGDYSFDLLLVPSTFTGDTLEAKIIVDVVAVPEPSTLALAFTGGLLALGRYRRGGNKR